jgi:DNA ligase-1
MKQLLASFLLALSLLQLPTPLFATEPPPLMLANIYRDEIPLTEYRISEKLDGMRGYWDGHRLFSRGGEIIHAPQWFTAAWPNVPLDGELWIARGRFAQTVSIVRKQTPGDAEWRQIHFMVFDLPAHPGVFDERDAALQQIVARVGQPWLQHVAQLRVSDHDALQAMLDRIVGQGGEGLMLHRGASRYRAERNDDLLKLKPFQDADARVVAHLPGKGKYAGMLGALQVETPEGLRFRLGSGFSDAERRTPPAPGSWVSYRYNGVNKDTGIPRFARFLRIRTDR